MRYGTNLSMDSGDVTPRPRRNAPRLEAWKHQPRNEDPYTPGQDIPERNRALLASLNDLVSKIAPDHDGVAARVANL